MEAATHPAKGNHYSRLLVVDDEVHVKHAYGVTSRVAALAHLRTEEDEFYGADLRLKLRLFKLDTGPVDTWMSSVVTGISWREEGKTSGRIGWVTTLIRSRHGLNAQIDWNSAEEESERGEGNASYLYRIYPGQYTLETKGAWYVMTESLNTVSSEGDIVSDLAGGILYEAQRWAIEVSYRQDDDEDHVGFGMRILW